MAASMIETDALTKDYGGRHGIFDLTMRVEPGEILGFLGPNGAGKSTTVKILTGMLKPDSGRAIVGGLDVVEHPVEVKHRIGYVPESGAMYESLTGREYLDLVASLYHLDRRVARARANEFVELFGLGDDQHRRISEYSKGMKQKVLISSALMHNPDLLLLDEPFGGLDANAALIVKDLVRKLAAQGRTVFFCSHILEVVERICTRVIVIDKGITVTSGTAEEIAHATGTATLEAAFGVLTGVTDVGSLTRDVLAALGDR